MSKSHGMSRRSFLTRTAGGLLASGAALNGAGVYTSAFAAADSTAKPKRGGTLVASWGGLEPQALFVPGGGGSSPFQTSTKILERLLKLDNQLVFQPVLAEQVTPSADFKTWTIKLRPGVKWHDGKDFTAYDVVFNVSEHWKPISAGVALKSLKSAEATDPSATYTARSRMNAIVSRCARPLSAPRQPEPKGDACACRSKPAVWRWRSRHDSDSPPCQNRGCTDLASGLPALLPISPPVRFVQSP